MDIQHNSMIFEELMYPYGMMNQDYHMMDDVSAYTNAGGLFMVAMKQAAIHRERAYGRMMLLDIDMPGRHPRATNQELRCGSPCRFLD